ncbi:MAG: ShlB/FhaC/HecB family hemolysin secretion/activation protein [Candidatus Gastranaerophilales bacterium]|nr:ShlB/FhaC/HecB family hemolysin secretion/activation protein [Candidatus Gastranaerophilales bacterium]
MHKSAKIKLSSIALAICFMIGTQGVFAGPEAGTNVIPNGIGNFDSGVIDQTNLRQIKDYEQRVRDDREREHQEEDIKMNKEMKDKLQNLPNKEVSFKLNSIHITGNTEYTEEQLMNLICDRVGDEVTINDLIGMANAITEHYQRNGYISTTAYLPPQKVEDGNVEIVVLEGKYGNITIEGNKWARKKYLNATFLKDKNIQEDKVLNVADIQESLREINATDYIKGAVALQDNEDSEQYTDLTLNVKDRFPIDFDFRFDNQGRSSVGLNRFVIFAGMSNLTGFGDQILSTTSIARSSIGQGVFYSVPIGRHETKLNLGYSYSGTEIDKGEFKPYKVKGQSHNFYVDLTRRLIKTENYKLYGDIAFDMRNTKTKMMGEERYGYRTRAIKFNLTNIKDDVYGKWFANVGIAKGIDVFGASNDLYGEYNKKVPTNKMVKLQASLARLQVLPWRMMGIFSANGQWVNRDVWYADKLQIGGISSVRGFEEGYFLRDYGVTGSLELRAPIPFLNHLPDKLRFIDDSIRLAAFCDMGWFGDYSYDYKSSDFVMSVGGGLVLKMTRYLSGNVYFGVPIVNRPHDASSMRVHFMITSNIL